MRIETDGLRDSTCDHTTNRQALLYAAHELHGFFAHLGVLDEHKGELRCFPASGRVARQGVPPGMIARCERRVAEAHGGGAHANAGPGAMLRGDLLCPVKVRSSSTDERVCRWILMHRFARTMD